MNILESFEESFESTYEDPHLASYQYEILMEQIRDFESTLDNDHEIVLKLTHLGKETIMIITNIGYSNPSLIHYYGYVNGNYAQLTQHISQINFLLSTIKKLDPSKNARRIGFNVD